MLKPSIVNVLLIIYYCVGIVGFWLDETYPIMINLVPLSLFMSFIVLMMYHKPWGIKTVLTFATIAIVSFFVEMIGTKTGLLFGNYWYGSTLGWQILKTPIIIAVNWLVLIYTIHLVLSKLKLNTLSHAVIGAILMTFFDFIMEPVAMKTNMWQWENDIIPMQNYVGWFVLSFVLFLFVRKTKITYQNPVALTMLICQFGLFVALRII